MYNWCVSFYINEKVFGLIVRRVLTIYGISVTKFGALNFVSKLETLVLFEMHKKKHAFIGCVIISCNKIIAKDNIQTLE